MIVMIIFDVLTYETISKMRSHNLYKCYIDYILNVIPGLHSEWVTFTM